MALLLFAVFAACILAVLLMGAESYQRLTQRGRASFDSRTAVQYVATKVRSADAQGTVTLEQWEGTDTLMLAEESQGTAYLTRIYYYDGYIRELFTDALGTFQPGDGEKILRVDGLSFVLEDTGLLTVTASDSSGTESTLTLSLRSGEGASS